MINYQQDYKHSEVPWVMAEANTRAFSVTWRLEQARLGQGFSLDFLEIVAGFDYGN